MSTNHVVGQGECLTRIASRYGFKNYRTIYDHPKNAEFKQKRPNPNLIHPGDVIFIPDKELKTESCSTARLHSFVVPSARRILRIVIEDADHVRQSNVAYEMVIEGRAYRGTTDAQGLLEQSIPVDAEEGTLRTEKYEWPLRIAHLNPVADSNDDGVSGLQARLRNMGYDPGNIDGLIGPKTRAAIRAFQAKNSLTVDGELNESTRAKIVDNHGC